MVRAAFRRMSVAVALVVCALLMAPGEIVRADALDAALMQHAKQVRDYLLKQKYETVGILAFRLQRGDEQPAFQGGTVVNSLPERLETALILSLRVDQDALRIVHDASRTAGDALGAANYRTEDQRKRLFDVTYKQAWGNPPPDVKADCFLAGKVSLSADLRKAQVLIEAFDRRDPGGVTDVLSFDVDVDRNVLAELGQGFSVSAGNSQSLLRAVTEDDVFKAVNATTVKEPQSATPSWTPAPKAFPIQVTLYYSDVPQQLTPDDQRAGGVNFVARSPTEGETLSIEVANTTKDKIGLVVMVNGISTLHEEKGQPNILKKWILDPDGDYTIKGYHQKGGTEYKLIRALSEQESQDRFADLGGEESAGLIQVYVFRPVPQVVFTSITVSPSIRVLTDSELAESRPGTLADLQSLIVPGKFNRGLFTWGDTRAETLESDKLGPVQLTDSMIIRYYRKPAE